MFRLLLSFIVLISLSWCESTEVTKEKGDDIIRIREEPVPMYLENASDDVKDQYFEIMSNDKITLLERKDLLRNLASQIKMEKEYSEHEDRESYTNHWLNIRVMNILKRLPGVYDELENTRLNLDQPVVLQKKRLFDLHRKYSNEVDVINFIIHQIVSSVQRQAPYTGLNEPKPYGDFDKVSVHSDNDKLEEVKEK